MYPIKIQKEYGMKLFIRKQNFRPRKTLQSSRNFNKRRVCRHRPRRFSWGSEKEQKERAAKI